VQGVAFGLFGYVNLVPLRKKGDKKGCLVTWGFSSSIMFCLF
jgi:hypothetical protein